MATSYRSTNIIHVSSIEKTNMTTESSLLQLLGFQVSFPWNQTKKNESLHGGPVSSFESLLKKSNEINCSSFIYDCTSYAWITRRIILSESPPSLFTSGWNCLTCTKNQKRRQSPFLSCSNFNARETLISCLILEKMEEKKRIYSGNCRFFITLSQKHHSVVPITSPLLSWIFICSQKVSILCLVSEKMQEKKIN